MATKSTATAVGAAVPATLTQPTVVDAQEFEKAVTTTAAIPGEISDPATFAAAVESGVITPIPGTTAPGQRVRPPAPAATVLPVDEFHGKGGDYVIGADGTRRPATPAA